jgi:hypothetical protein
MNIPMLTNKNTTYILMERGVTDKGLFLDLERIVAQLGITYREFHEAYPYLAPFVQCLKDELSSDEPN